MFDHMHYNRIFIAAAQKGFLPNNDATKYGVLVSKPTANSEWVWRVIGVHKLTGVENNGNHHVYCDVLDANGLRVNLAKLTLKEHNGNILNAVIDKPQNEPGTNFPLWSDKGVALWVTHPFNDRQIPSEVVSGLHYGWPDEDSGNTWGHHSYYVVFKAMRGIKPKPPVVVPPTQPPTRPDQPEPITWMDGAQFAIDDKYLYHRIRLSDIEATQQAMRFIR